MKFPSDKEIKRVLALLEDDPGSKLLPKNATKGDILKYELCKKFVIYKNKNKLMQKDLAKKLGTDSALVSKILNYHIEEFTVDRLLALLLKIYPKTTIRVDEAS